MRLKKKSNNYQLTKAFFIAGGVSFAMHKQITGLYLNQPLPKKSEMASNGSNGDNNDTDGRYHMIFLNTTHLSTHLRGNQPSQDKVHIYML